MKLEDLDEESKKRLKEELLQEIMNDEKENRKTKEIVKEAVKEVSREKESIEEHFKWLDFAFISTGILALATIILFMLNHIYWAIGVAALSVLNILFIVFRKKLPEVLLIILSVIQGVVVVGVIMVFVFLTYL